MPHACRGARGQAYISHADFLAAIQPLADYRASRGIRVSVIDVQDIYDEFSHGMRTPHAIKDFLQVAYSTWAGPVPEYVVLLGDGSYDFKGSDQDGPASFI